MKKLSILTGSTPLLVTVALIGCAGTGSQDSLSTVAAGSSAVSAPAESAEQVVAASPEAVAASETASTSTGGALTDLLMQKTGVNQTQAEGGAGALFQFAKSKMQAATFSKLEQSVPGVQGLMGAASATQQPSALGGLAGGAASSLSGGTLSNAISVVSAFQQHGMSPQLVQQFVPIVVDYVKSSAGSSLAGSLSSALAGL